MYLIPRSQFSWTRCNLTKYTYKVKLLTCPKLELLIKYNLGRLCSSLELELSLKRHLGSLCSSPKLELFNLGLRSTCSKSESTRSYRKSVVLKRKRLIGIVTQINRMKNHWKTITSEWETFNFFRFAIKLFLFPSFTAQVFQHVTYIFAQIHVSALRNEDSY